MARSDTGEAVEIGAKNVALQGKVGEFATALDADEAGVLEFFHVVGERGGADGLRLGDAATGRGAVAAADLGKNFVAAGLGEGLGNQSELLVREVAGCPGRMRFGHCFYLTPPLSLARIVSPCMCA